MEGMCLSSPLSLGLGRWQPGCCDNAKREEEGEREKGGREREREKGGREGEREKGGRREGAKPGLSTNPLLALREAAVL